MSSPRVYVYGVKDGVKEFMATSLDRKGARGYCEKIVGVFPNRFDYLIYGSIIEIQEGGYETFQVK